MCFVVVFVAMLYDYEFFVYDTSACIDLQINMTIIAWLFITQRSLDKYA